MIKFTISTLVAIACVVGLMALGVAAFFITTPRPTNIRECLTTEMYKVRLCPGENSYTKLSNISTNVRNAVIVSEDSTFYSHNGFDWFELRESFEKNLKSGSYARGGSTITQQLAKNVYLSSEKSILRKLREVVITVQIESMLSKDEILEKYLNVVEFGPNLFGIGKAARHYFGKSPGSLTPAEGAFLAFLLPNPEGYSVSFRRKQLTPFARSQTRQIVKRLARFKKISADQEAEALTQVDYMFGSTPAPLPADESTIPEDTGEYTETPVPSAPQSAPTVSSEEEEGPAEIIVPSQDPVVTPSEEEEQPVPEGV